MRISGVLLSLFSVFLFFGSLFDSSCANATDQDTQEGYLEWEKHLDSDDMYILWLLFDASALSDIYFGFEPGSIADFVRLGLSPFAPDKLIRDDIRYIEQFLSGNELAKYENPFTKDARSVLPSLDELGSRVTAQRIDSCTPEQILAFRFQLLARMPKSRGAIESNGEYAVLFKCSDFPHFIQSTSDTVYNDCEVVDSFFENPYTGNPAKRHLWLNDLIEQGDILILPANEWWREVAGNDSVETDLYHRFVVVFVGADPGYGMRIG